MLDYRTTKREYVDVLLRFIDDETFRTNFGIII